MNEAKNQEVECTCGHCGHRFKAVPEFRHRILCGDSTKASDVARLMGGEKAALCLTDPPYGIGESYDSHKDTPEELRQLIAGFLPVARNLSTIVLLTPGLQNIWEYPPPRWILAWGYPAGAHPGPWGFCCWQPVLAYGKDPYLAARKGSRPDFLNLTEAADNSLGHPCSKPLGVWSWLLERGSINRGDVIFDPFIGSGTTLIAAERLGRKCRGIDISAAYVNVCLTRWESECPGQTAQLLDRLATPGLGAG